MTNLETSDATRPSTYPSLSLVMRAAHSMVSSPEPAAVFASLVQVCAPMLCEAASATISGPDELVFAKSWVKGTVHPAPPLESVVRHFSAPATDAYTSYHGTVSLRFSVSDGSQPLIAQLLVERAMANVERERLRAAASGHKAVADNLELALPSNREIAVAVGILMANHKLSDDQALDLLRRVSRRTNRKLRAVAVEVAIAGAINLPAGVAVVDTTDIRRGHLVSVPAPRHF